MTAMYEDKARSVLCAVSIVSKDPPDHLHDYQGYNNFNSIGKTTVDITITHRYNQAAFDT